jgi:TonB-dependent receptor
MRVPYILILFIPCLILKAQNATFNGSITDEENTPLIGVNVTLKSDRGLFYGGSSDIDGHFVINNIKPGSHTLNITYIGFSPITRKVDLKSGENASSRFKLTEAAASLMGTTVTAERVYNTERALVLATKDAKEVVSGISMQQIQKSQDGNAAQVMQRVPGVTVVSNRFVMIRGISERYNAVMINNVVAPSTEVDKRTFSFDLLSSGSLDRMLVYKSGAPDMPGDFAGGVIKITTKSDVKENYTKLHFDVGYRENTTFRPYFQSKGSSTDILGFDNGFRSLPSGFPSSNDYQNLNNASPIKAEWGQQLENNFIPLRANAMPDMGVGISLGRKLKIKGNPLSMHTFIGLSQSQLQYQRSFNRYFEWTDKSQDILPWERYTDEQYNKSNTVNIMSNWTYNMGAGNTIKFSNFLAQVGENETILRRGRNYLQRPDDEWKNYLLGYQSRTIYSGQLEGIHQRDENRFDWVVGFSYLGENEPDLRRFRTFRSLDANDEDPFIMMLPPSSNIFETGRYWGNLSETSNNIGLDYTKELNRKGNQVTEIKVGYYGDYRSRSFTSRYFSYLYPGFFDPVRQEEIVRMPLADIFAPENIRSRDGLVLEEGTRPIDSYSATNLLNAAYIKFVVPYKRFNLSGGVRGEYNIQQLLSTDNLGSVNVYNPIFATLPFLNASYFVSPKNKLRMSAMTTVNRPEFRELAPFLFYDYKFQAGRYGDENLRMAVIQNIDARWEYYPRAGEVISLGVFYKYFDSPIENRSVITTEQPSLSYMNADWAQNYGTELEIRLSMRDRAPGTFWDNFALNLNGSYIISEVDLGESAVAQTQVRPLEGQSPYIINAGLYYDQPKNKLNIGLQYNIFGPRIFLVGDDNFPTIYELPRHALDLSINKQLGKSVDMKLGIQNILNYAYRFYQDSDRNEKIDDRDHEVMAYQVGSLTTLSFTIRLN